MNHFGLSSIIKEMALKAQLSKLAPEYQNIQSPNPFVRPATAHRKTTIMLR